MVSRSGAVAGALRREGLWGCSPRCTAGASRVDSTLGRGSTFSVYLPGPGGGRARMKGRVLVIEDDQDISLGIRTVLSRQGLEVDSSADGKQGLRAFHLARPEPFDLVVLDIGLPAMDRWAVLERIRDLSDVPVLILTAHGQEGDKVRGSTAVPMTT
jgi:CheY-like chemotaxis protein